MRPLVAVGLVVLLALGGLGAACGGSDDGQVSSLRTGFELRKGSSWTSLGEEGAFLRDLDAASGRVRVTEIGRSVQRRPLRLVTVGAPRTPEQIAAGSTMLFVCAQHGTEPAGREACLQAARDAVGAIGSATLLIIPNANPDGLAVGERGNADRVDVNRDHMDLDTPEARAIARVVRDFKPDLIGDFHEYKEEGATEVLLGDPAKLHLNADPRIRRLSGELDRYAVRALRAARFETGVYPSLTRDADESVLRQQAALRHSPSLLVETPRRGTLSPLRRASAHRAAMRALLAMFREQSRRLATDTSAAQRAALAEGASGDRRYYYRSPTRSTDRPPCGYRLTEDELRDAQDELRLQGIATRRDGSSWLVPAGQPGQPRIGLLLDARAPRKVADAEPVAC